MISLLFVSLAQFAATPDLPSGAIHTNHARRNVIARLDGAAAQSALACAGACGINHQCQAWTWRPQTLQRGARCDLHPIAGPVSPWPSAVTGLSPHLAQYIEHRAESTLTDKELQALSIIPTPPRTRQNNNSELAGGQDDPH